MAQWQIDRSGILEAQKCPRARYYSRHFNGSGIEKKQKSLPLAFGSAFHEGAEVLLGEPIAKNAGEWGAHRVDVAVTRAHKYLDEQFANSKVDLEEKQTEYAVLEQKAIAEGLLRAWWSHDGERFLRDFEVLEVEQEGRAVLLPEPHYNMGEGDMVLMFRPDALVRERQSGDLYIVSWKTASTFGQYTLNQCAVDMQSMSEVWGVVRTHSSYEGGGEDYDSDCRIEGVLYLFAVKGQRRMDDYLGFKTQSTPLAYGWVRKGPTPEDDEWAHTYGWQTEEVNPKTGKLVSTKLGKGFRKLPVWSDYPGGVKQWIDDLANQRIEPRHINALDAIFPQSLPVSRRADEIDAWKTQVIGQEMEIQRKLDARERAMEVGSEGDWLDFNFPQHTARCFDYQSKCSFFDICWNPAVKSDPLASGLYQIRQANHPERGGDDVD